MKDFICGCGAIIHPPILSPTMFLGESKNVFFISISYLCPKCQKKHTSNYGERIKTAKIKV